MTAMAQEPRLMTPEETLLDYFLTLETPEGFRAEFIEGEIVVSPAPDGDHEDAIELIVAQMYDHAKVRMQYSGNKGLKLPRGGSCPKNYAIPDATFAPRERRLFRGAPTWMPPEGVAMVAEVTSSKPERDRIAKRHCYARAGIPLYLLVDRDESTVTLFAEPAKEDYTEVHSVPFGKSLPLPAPFDFDLDTTDFL
ncbi:Uma2 family endonuclease [Streptomyces mobaraensis]|uniref:Uma2 family endonuclease n=1 Tax=Streptomyces mobaraensis TaxID=35621 RepID=A0A5N5WC86_STRMB|nr:Uma2 family endonuclease [Streptomyces mobaraensis]KAB7848318.1 Uma2 family endonuclease [Streptomyces mobaraensis]